MFMSMSVSMSMSMAMSMPMFMSISILFSCFGKEQIHSTYSDIFAPIPGRIEKFGKLSYCEKGISNRCQVK
jgi:hypothetical protein